MEMEECESDVLPFRENIDCFLADRKEVRERERTIFVRESEKREQKHNTKGQNKKKTSLFLIFSKWPF